jgi:hypothetical protein
MAKDNMGSQNHPCYTMTLPFSCKITDTLDRVQQRLSKLNPRPAATAVQ